MKRNANEQIDKASNDAGRGESVSVKESADNSGGNGTGDQGPNDTGIGTGYQERLQTGDRGASQTQKPLNFDNTSILCG